MRAFFVADWKVKMLRNLKISLIGVAMGLFLVACAPEVGSPEWCDDMDDTAKGDWSTNDATEYSKNCVFRKRDSD